MVQNRKTNIEILRIISMIMIIAHHYVFYGVQQNYSSEIARIIYNGGTILNQLYCQILLPGGAVGVGIFFILMGYFGIISDEMRIKKMYRL